MTASLAPNIKSNNNIVINPASNKKFDIANVNLSDFKTSDASGTNFSKIMTDAASAKTQQAHTKFVDKAVKSNTSSINKKALDETSAKTEGAAQNKNEPLNNTDDKKNINNQEEKTLKNEKQDYKKAVQNKTENTENEELNNETSVNFENKIDETNVQKDSEIKKDFNKKPQIINKNDTSEILNDIENSSFVDPSPVFSSNVNEDKTQNDTAALIKDKITDLSNNAVGEAPQKQNNTQKDDLLTDMVEEINSLIENIANSQNSSNLSQDNKKDFLEALENLKASLENTSLNKKEDVDFDNLLNTINESLNNISIDQGDICANVDFEKLEDVLSSIKSSFDNSSSSEEIKNLINETQNAINNKDISSLDAISQNLDTLLKETTKSNPQKAEELNNSLADALDYSDKNINNQIENLNEIANAINQQNENTSIVLDQNLKNSLSETKEFINNINENDLKEFVKNNNIDSKNLDEILNLINSCDENQNDISLVNEISLKLNEILKNTDIKEEISADNIVQKLNSLNENIKEFSSKENNQEISADFENNDSKTVETNSNLADSNNSNDSKNNAEDSNLEQLKNDLVEKMDIEIKSSSTLDESGALSVADEVAKIALSETSTAASSTAGNIVYDSASGNGVLISNVQNLKNMQTSNFQMPNTIEQQLDSSDILNQIGNKLSDLAQENGKKLTMVLRPYDLGRLSIELSTNKDGLTTNIIAQNDDVRNYIEKNINNLRQQLSDAGVNVNNIQIKTAGQEGSTKYDGTFNQNQQENNQNNQQGDNKNQQDNNKQNEYEKIISGLDYDFNFAKDFSNVLNKTLSYSLNK